MLQQVFLISQLSVVSLSFTQSLAISNQVELLDDARSSSIKFSTAIEYFFSQCYYDVYFLRDHGLGRSWAQIDLEVGFRLETSSFDPVTVELFEEFQALPIGIKTTYYWEMSVVDGAKSSFLLRYYSAELLQAPAELILILLY